MFSQPNCSSSPVFNGAVLRARKKIVLMMLFGFEVWPILQPSAKFVFAPSSPLSLWRWTCWRSP